MIDVAAFVLARLDEWEQAARAAIAERSRVTPDAPVPDMVFEAWPDLGIPAVVVGPERVLAEVAALRGIVEHAEQAISQTTMTDATAEAYRTAMEWTLRALAGIWADHPDYNRLSN